jgi:hypothetical protein
MLILTNVSVWRGCRGIGLALAPHPDSSVCPMGRASDALASKGTLCGVGLAMFETLQYMHRAWVLRSKEETSVSLQRKIEDILAWHCIKETCKNKACDDLNLPLP